MVEEWKGWNIEIGKVEGGSEGVYDKNMGRFDRSFYLAYNLNA